MPLQNKQMTQGNKKNEVVTVDALQTRLVLARLKALEEHLNVTSNKIKEFIDHFKKIKEHRENTMNRSGGVSFVQEKDSGQTRKNIDFIHGKLNEALGEIQKLRAEMQALYKEYGVISAERAQASTGMGLSSSRNAEKKEGEDERE